MRTVLVTGAGGQLGWELQRNPSGKVRLVALTEEMLDLTREDQVRQALREVRPDVLINAAAYTAVDRAEEEPEKAFLINESVPAALARMCRKLGIHLIHVSTDFVFDGSSARPYKPTDPPRPLSVYGRSKLAGEEAIFREYEEGSTVVRTAWLYSSHGANFVKTMIRLFAERSEVRVVADQVGTPTWAANLARFLLFLASRETPPKGIFHFTDAGVASWYDFAVAIEEETRDLRSHEVRIRPIASSEFPTAAARPPYSVLDKSKSWSFWPEEPMHWRKGLRCMLSELTARREAPS